MLFIYETDSLMVKVSRAPEELVILLIILFIVQLMVLKEYYFYYYYYYYFADIDRRWVDAPLVLP